MVLSALVLVIVFKLVSTSTTSMDILGNAFGVIIINEFDEYASLFYQMYLEPFHNKIVHGDDFLKSEISMVANITCFFCISVLTFDCIFISNVMVEGTIDILKYNQVDSS